VREPSRDGAGGHPMDDPLNPVRLVAPIEIPHMAQEDHIWIGDHSVWKEGSGLMMMCVLYRE